MDVVKKDIAVNLKRLRKQQGYTQAQLAKESGLNYRHLQKIEAASSDLKLGTIFKLASTLNIPTWKLLYHSDRTEVSHSIEKTSILNQLPTPVLLLDRYGKIVYSNSSFKKQFLKDDDDRCLGELVSTFLFEPVIDAEKLNFGTFNDSKLEATPEIVVSLADKDGSPIRSTIFWNLFFDSHNKHIGFLLTIFKS